MHEQKQKNLFSLFLQVNKLILSAKKNKQAEAQKKEFCF